MRKDIPRYGTSEYRSYAYKLAKEARRGVSFPYINDKKHLDLVGSGYKEYVFESGNIYTHSVLSAKEVVTTLRADGFFARIYCRSNKVRYTEYEVWYKAK